MTTDTGIDRTMVHAGTAAYAAQHLLELGTDKSGAAGIDLASSNSSTARCIAAASVPVLVCAGTADTQVHLPHAELLYNAATSTADRTMAFIAGAEHDLTPAATGAADTRAAHLDVLADWLATRYLGSRR